MTEQLKASDVELEKKQFHSSKKTINMVELDMEEISISNSFPMAKIKKRIKNTS